MKTDIVTTANIETSGKPSPPELAITAIEEKKEILDAENSGVAEMNINDDGGKIYITEPKKP